MDLSLDHRKSDFSVSLPVIKKNACKLDEAERLSSESSELPAKFNNKLYAISSSSV